jgi:ADP-dependent NAD(P)H-hydrate dehydratase / NAD(P)H-hydrate epimerase
VIPVLTPTEMAAVDAAAPEPVEVLIDRAGFAVARTARRMLGGAYGKHVLVVAGRGNNGADGRTAARYLTAWGASVRIVEASSLGGGERLPGADLVIDAAYGTGLSRRYQPPDPGPTPVLSVDIPSGLSGVTGLPEEGGDAFTAARTVTFASYKPGLLQGVGPEHTGPVDVARIGLEALAGEVARMWLVDDDDVARLLPRRPRETHKWQSAVQVVAGSPAMYGAPLLVATAAMRAGSGYALVGVPGAPPGGGLPPGEHVARALPEHDWDRDVADSESGRRAKALVIGPGLGPLARTAEGGTGADTPVGRLLRATSVPAVVDADGITALGSLEAVRDVAAGRGAPVVLTPHAGEYARLTGNPPGDDRIEAARSAAAGSGAVFLLKGSPTVVAAPDGRTLIVSSGSSRLATAGTGDVLSGVIGAFLARGLPAWEAAALGAHCHGRAAALGRAEGLVASDLPDLVSAWLSAVIR